MGTVQQFFKGLLMALMAIIVTAFTQQPIDWGTTIILLIGTALGYIGKNIFLQSESPSGWLDWRDLVSGILVAVGAGLSSYVEQIVTETIINWTTVWHVAVSVALTYLSTTFFAPAKAAYKPLSRAFKKAA